MLSQLDGGLVLHDTGNEEQHWRLSQWTTCFHFQHQFCIACESSLAANERQSEPSRCSRVAKLAVKHLIASLIELWAVPVFFTMMRLIQRIVTSCKNSENISLIHIFELCYTCSTAIS